MRQHIMWQATSELPYVLNLDRQFTPFKGVEITYKNHTFKGGEPHLQIQEIEYAKRLDSSRNP